MASSAEIEAASTGTPDVTASVVAACPDVNGDRRLIAWTVAAPGAAITAASLREHLAEWLPDYMIPTSFVPIDAIPLSATGKADLDALPDPAAARPSPPLLRRAPLAHRDRDRGGLARSARPRARRRP
ncbi:MAG: hypothetical protein R3F59_31155 [Myxococcota bacterium]